MELGHVGEAHHVLQLVLGKVQVEDGWVPVEGCTGRDLILIKQKARQSGQGDGGERRELVLGEDQVLKVVQGLVSCCSQEFNRGDLVLGCLESQQDRQVQDL